MVESRFQHSKSSSNPDDLIDYENDNSEENEDNQENEEEQEVMRNRLR